MSDELKLKKFQKKIDSFIKSNKATEKEIHALRVATRELYSLLDSDKPFKKEIKKILKLSNNIRDIDVFLDIYLKFLPKEYRSKMNMENVVQLCHISRKTEVDIFYKYLKTLMISSSINMQDAQYKVNLTKKIDLKFDKEVLHKYRIGIKKMLFKEKNALKQNKNKIKTLTEIKDILGEINDKMNGVERLKDYGIEPALLLEIQNFTQEYNLKLFNKFQKIKTGEFLS